MVKYTYCTEDRKGTYWSWGSQARRHGKNWGLLRVILCDVDPVQIACLMWSTVLNAMDFVNFSLLTRLSFKNQQCPQVRALFVVSLSLEDPFPE